MGDHRIPLVGARRKQHGRPEPFHPAKCGPHSVPIALAKIGLSDLILANPAIKGFEQVGNAVFGYSVMHGAMFGILPSSQLFRE